MKLLWPRRVLFDDERLRLATKTFNTYVVTGDSEYYRWQDRMVSVKDIPCTAFPFSDQYSIHRAIYSSLKT